VAGHLTIGEFARRSWLSTKALRLYDARGILVPDVVDPVTGYRRYSEAQLDLARLVVLLRRIDMPLSEIRIVLAASVQERGELIATFRGRREADFARQQGLAEFLERAVSGRRLDGYGLAAEARFPVRVRDVPAQGVITRRRALTAEDLPEFIASAIGELAALAAGAGGVAAPPFVVYHGEVSWESDGPVEVCVPVVEHERAHRVEPEHSEAYVQVPKSRVQFPSILEAFEAVRAWPEAHGRVALALPREIYFADFGRAQADEMVCDVAVPVSPEPRPASASGSSSGHARTQRPRPRKPSG
jgi:DNA-binding transcriptional MerR regulator